MPEEIKQKLVGPKTGTGVVRELTKDELEAEARQEKLATRAKEREKQKERSVVIEFKNVTKEYKLYSSDRARILGLLFKKVHFERVCANNDLSFQIRQGESVAFLGPNGAGKSTALKMITGVVFPTKGEIEVKGRVSALLELGAGFDNGLTGRQNIHLRSQIWGFSSQEARELEPDIIEFADLGSYIDQPMRTYSSGMRARLGFAFASSINPDILVVDEALSVGDRAFSKKCRNRVDEIMADSNVTVLFVTHSSGAAKEFCRRGIVISHGQKMFDGPIQDAIDFYESD